MKEPGLGCLSSLGSQRKEDLGDRFRELAWDKLLLPIPLLAAVWWGPLELRCVPVGEGEEEGEGKDWLRLLPRGRACPGSFIFSFDFSLVGGKCSGDQQEKVPR